jgi:hypothetical protein
MPFLSVTLSEAPPNGASLMSKYFVSTIAQLKSTLFLTKIASRWHSPQIADKRITYDELTGHRAEQP